MDPAQAMAEKSVGAIWRESHRYGLIDATPLRQGRGVRGDHPKGRRRESPRGRAQFEDVVRSIEVGIRSESLSLEAARRQIHEANLDESIRITETKEETIEVIAHFYALGYYLWNVDGESDKSSVGLLRASFATRKELT